VKFISYHILFDILLMIFHYFILLEFIKKTCHVIDEHGASLKAVFSWVVILCTVLSSLDTEATRP